MGMKVGREERVSSSSDAVVVVVAAGRKHKANTWLGRNLMRMARQIPHRGRTVTDGIMAYHSVRTSQGFHIRETIERKSNSQSKSTPTPDSQRQPPS